MPLRMNIGALAATILLLSSCESLRQPLCLLEPELADCTTIEKVEPTRLFVGVHQTLTITFREEDIFSTAASIETIAVTLRASEGRPEIPLEPISLSAKGKTLKVLVDKSKLANQDSGLRELHVRVGVREASAEVRVAAAPRFGEVQQVSQGTNHAGPLLRVTAVRGGAANLALFGCIPGMKGKTDDCQISVVDRSKDGTLGVPAGTDGLPSVISGGEVTSWVGMTGGSFLIMKLGSPTDPKQNTFQKYQIKTNSYEVIPELRYPLVGSLPFADPQGALMAIASSALRGETCIPTLDVLSPEKDIRPTALPLAADFSACQLAFGTAKLAPTADAISMANYGEPVRIPIVLALDHKWTAMVWRKQGGVWTESRNFSVIVTNMLASLAREQRVPVGAVIADADLDGLLDILVVSAPAELEPSAACPPMPVAARSSFLVHILPDINFEEERLAVPALSTLSLLDVPLPPGQERRLNDVAVSDSAFGDFDHDGDIDLALADSRNKLITLLLNSAM